MMNLTILTIVGLMSWLFTFGLRRYAIAKSIIDIPNARSSHSIPTPRGGGVSIVVTFLAACPWLILDNSLSIHSAIALVGAGLLVAIIGFMDDLGHIAARWRLLGHFSASIWALIWLGGLPPIPIFGSLLDLGLLGNIVAVFYLVWMLNLYNFMDGIDGIASIEAMSVCCAACVLYVLSGNSMSAATPLLLSVAVGGFLYWNFPPARIFMGDAGSGFLGITVGILSLQAAFVHPLLIWCWLILLGVFIVDSTFTLLRRLIRGDKVYEAHRSHAYQFASRKHGNHLPITLCVLAINVLWLFPIALAVLLYELDGFTALIVAYIPLVMIVIGYKAGSIENSSP